MWAENWKRKFVIWRALKGSEIESSGCVHWCRTWHVIWGRFWHDTENWINWRSFEKKKFWTSQWNVFWVLTSPFLTVFQLFPTPPQLSSHSPSHLHQNLPSLPVTNPIPPQPHPFHTVHWKMSGVRETPDTTFAQGYSAPGALESEEFTRESDAAFVEKSAFETCCY